MAEVTQRRVQREVQVSMNLPRQRVSEKDHHRVRMSGEPHQELFFKSVPLPADRDAQEEQDEGSCGSRWETAHYSVVRPV